MLSDFLKKNNITSQAGFIKANGYGFGQVEPNHLSAQRTAQVYAQLPAAKDINVLEQGQFVKYDYANGEVNFTGAGEWMLVFNEIKLYRDNQMDCEFALIKDNYQARIYSPFGYGLDKDGNPTSNGDVAFDRQARYLNGVDAEGQDSIAINGNTYKFDDVTAGADIYEPTYNEDPFHIAGPYKEAKMKDGTAMVPRVFKTNVGDIFTTNMIADASVNLGDKLTVNAADGILKVNTAPAAGEMTWQVVKVYTMPDHQPGVKIMRIA